MPTITQAALSVVFSIILLGVVFRNHLVDWLSGSSGISAQQLQVSYQGELTKLTHIGFMPELTIGVFWAGVGVVGYVVVVELVNLFISARNEVVVNTTFTNMGPAHNRLVRPLTRIGIAAAWLIYIVVAAQLLLPLWTNLIGNFLLGQATAANIGSALGAIIGLAVTLYFGWLLGIILKNYH